MNHDFKTVINRSEMSSSKWESMKRRSPGIADNIVPLSVADMELKHPQELISQLSEFMEKLIFGYTDPSDKFYESVCQWMRTRHEWEIEKDWIIVFPGIVPAISNAVQAYTEPGDGVILLTPVYHPFYDSISRNDRTIVKSSLIESDKSYKIDFDDLKLKASDSKNKMLIFCSPHNPVGRVWTKSELLQVAEICLDNNVLIVSDEIHFDIILPGHEHHVFASMSDRIAENCITCTSPSKTFNLAGMQISNIIIKNSKLREDFNNAMKRNSIAVHNPIAFAATEIVYTSCISWLDEFIDLINKNKAFLENYLSINIPEISVFNMEGTYLQWWDCRGLQMSQEELESFMKTKVSAFFSEGYIFGSEGSCFERINLACPTSVLEELVLRLKSALENRRKENNTT